MDWQSPIIVWVVIAIIFFIIEIVTPGVFFFACLGLGALAAALSLWLGASYWLSWASFIGIGLVGILISRPLAERFSGKTARHANVDALIGKKGKVIKTIDPSTNEGSVTVDREEWRAEADEKIEAGSTIEVIAVEGVHVKVKKVG